jgi:imidazole glycerol phosphate synthase subunit HisF
MLSKRLIACLGVRDGQLAKSVKFVDTKDIGDPVEKAREYYLDGLDELVFYDITASSDKRNIMLDVVEAVAEQVFIPLSVGGGVRSVADATDLRLAGAEKINVNRLSSTAAVSPWVSMPSGGRWKVSVWVLVNWWSTPSTLMAPGKDTN